MKITIFFQDGKAMCALRFFHKDLNFLIQFYSRKNSVSMRFSGARQHDDDGGRRDESHVQQGLRNARLGKHRWKNQGYFSLNLPFSQKKPTFCKMDFFRSGKSRRVSVCVASRRLTRAL